ncbi:UNVERIFIED_CONTAM: cation transporter [Streptococcus canis]|uniref:cation diffusion facilitator family transporter n=1 Tax=Streptococcus canis TaxID=1329 RepID=UPI003D325F8A
MTASRNIQLVFWLNLGFAIIEMIFACLFSSGAVWADAIHDCGDALAIGLSAWLDRYAHRPKDNQFTMGYHSFRLLGALLTGLVLIGGSVGVILTNFPKLWNPPTIDSQGTLVLGIFAIVINLAASFIVNSGQTATESLLSLHFLEDILGWLGVILVSLVLRVREWYILDPLLSLLIAVFILSKALPKMWETMTILLGALPQSISYEALQSELAALCFLKHIHQLNIWSLDGLDNKATIHICLTNAHRYDDKTCRQSIHQIFKKHHIQEATIEIDQSCRDHDSHGILS